MEGRVAGRSVGLSRFPRTGTDTPFDIVGSGTRGPETFRWSDSRHRPLPPPPHDETRPNPSLNPSPNLRATYRPQTVRLDLWSTKTEGVG